MIDIKQSRDLVTKHGLFHLTIQASSREKIIEGQFKITGHCIQMPTDEIAIHFVIYESKIRSSFWQGAPRMTYLFQISSHIRPGEKTLEVIDIRKMAVKIS